MSAFEYTALNRQGKNRRGVLEGDTARQIRSQLRDQGLTPLTVAEVSQQDKKHSTESVFKKRISPMDLALLTRQLSTLLSSGMPLEEVLRSVAAQSEKASIKRVILSIRSRVREGHSLSTGLSDFPSVFPELYRKTVEAGEESGHLDTVLDRLADYTESRQQMLQKTTMALVYPVLLIIISVLIVIALLTFVVPQIVRVFENVAQDLPAATLILISISDFIKNNGIIMIVLTIIAVAIAKAILKKPEPKLKWHQFLLKLPFAGRLIRGANSARFSRTLSILSSSNVQILEALRISGQVITNLPMRKAVEEITAKVKEGATIHASMEQSGYFPPMTVSLISSGESSGNLEDMLERAAIIQEREIESILATALGLLGPVMILFMGGIVLFIVLATLLPVFDLNELVG
ncbi:MAG TPA: type II secretion system protein GspF [Gammaproteobacteria bacterium]|mgnify:CR=1 FL=1|nr:type II secretion system protein GspF [Gammaproteobacteria bacterium]